MGRIVAPFGVLGWLRVQPFTAEQDGLLAYPVWWVGRDLDSKGGGAGNDANAPSRWQWREVTVAEGRIHGNSLVVRIDGCADRTRALGFKGLTVAVTREQLPAAAPGEFYQADLVGLKVVNQVGEDLGAVTGIIETGANIVLVVQRESERPERLIPFIATVVAGVDLAGGRMTVDWDADY